MKIGGYIVTPTTIWRSFWPQKYHVHLYRETPGLWEQFLIKRAARRAETPQWLIDWESTQMVVDVEHDSFDDVEFALLVSRVCDRLTDLGIGGVVVSASGGPQRVIRFTCNDADADVALFASIIQDLIDKEVS